MSTPLPTPRYNLHDRVRYKPARAHPAWPTGWHPEPWRIVGREATQLLFHADVVTYVIQPYSLSGHWSGHDTPLVVFEDQVELWPEAGPTYHPKEAFEQLTLLVG
jgi:hypothetical protein